MHLKVIPGYGQRQARWCTPSLILNSYDRSAGRLRTRISTSPLVSAATFNAAAGKGYYCRVEVEQRIKYPALGTLEALDKARGEFRLASPSPSSPRVKDAANQEAGFYRLKYRCTMCQSSP
jgi:hypothetical protein